MSPNALSAKNCSELGNASLPERRRGPYQGPTRPAWKLVEVTSASHRRDFRKQADLFEAEEHGEASQPKGHVGKNLEAYEVCTSKGLQEAALLICCGYVPALVPNSCVYSQCCAE